MVAVRLPVVLPFSLSISCWTTKVVDSPSVDCTRYRLLALPETIVTARPLRPLCAGRIPSAFQFCRWSCSPVNSKRIPRNYDASGPTANHRLPHEQVRISPFYFLDFFLFTAIKSTKAVDEHLAASINYTATNRSNAPSCASNDRKRNKTPRRAAPRRAARRPAFTILTSH